MTTTGEAIVEAVHKRYSMNIKSAAEKRALGIAITQAMDIALSVIISGLCAECQKQFRGEEVSTSATPQTIVSPPESIPTECQRDAPEGVDADAPKGALGVLGATGDR